MGQYVCPGFGNTMLVYAQDACPNQVLFSLCFPGMVKYVLLGNAGIRPESTDRVKSGSIQPGNSFFHPGVYRECIQPVQPVQQHAVSHFVPDSRERGKRGTGIGQIQCGQRREIKRAAGDCAGSGKQIGRTISAAQAGQVFYIQAGKLISGWEAVGARLKLFTKVFTESADNRTDAGDIVALGKNKGA